MLETVTPANADPVTLAEAKAQLGIDDAETAFDGLIGRLIKAAVASLEAYTGQKFMRQTVKLHCRSFPDAALELGVAPLHQITEVAYRDADGALQTLTGGGVDYYAVPYGLYPSIVPADYWPATQSEDPLAVSVTMEVGHDNAANVAPDVKAAVLIRVHEMFENRGETIASDELTEVPLTVKLLLNPHRRRRAG